MIPREKEALVITYQGEDFTIGEFNVSTTTGRVRVSAADEYTILTADSQALRTDEGQRKPEPGETFRWNIGKIASRHRAVYEYTVMSEYLPEQRGWLMRRTDAMPRREPRMWSTDGTELPAGTVRLEELERESRAATAEARAAAAGPGGAWQKSRSHEDAAGVAFPRLHRMAVPDHQLLLTFRSAVEADVFWKWVSEHGWKMFGDRDELLG